MDNLTNIVKLTILKLTDYKVKRDDWAKIMKNNNIPQELKHFINGVRYLYVNYMMNEINKIHNKCLRIYPVGSSNLTSDKDIQITFNLNCKENDKFFQQIINRTTYVINKSFKIWKTTNLLNLIDTNFYPPSLLNFITKINKTYNNKYIKTLKDKEKIVTIFIPQFTNDMSIKNFYSCEINNLEKQKKENINKFYKYYKKDTASCFKKLVDCYQNKIKLTDIEFNKLICCLVKYNHIGPEMYFTVSSIIIVVWYLQMKGKLSKKELEIMAPIAYEENKTMYLKTKKEKYKERYKFCMKYM